MYVTCIYLFLLAMPWLNITHFIKFISSTTNCVSSIEVYLIKKKKKTCAVGDKASHVYINFHINLAMSDASVLVKGSVNFWYACAGDILAWHSFVACKRMHDTLHTMELRSPSGVLGFIRACAAIEIFGMVGKIHTPVTLDSTAVRKWHR